jgi:CheY-like chemotaxis protein
VILEKMDYEVHCAQNGFQALQMIKAIDYSTIKMSEIYSFVLMDLHMPVLDGWESCKKITSFFEGNKLVKLETNNNESSSILELELSNFKPIIAACSSDSMEGP